MTKIDIVKDDQLYNLNFSLQDANGNAFDLSDIGGATTLLFKSQKTDKTSAHSGAMSIISATEGTCCYTVPSGVFTESGRYYGEIEITFGNNKIQTFSDIIINVKADLPK